MLRASTPVCPVCRSLSSTNLGPPAHHQPPKVAGVPIELDDLDLRLWRCGSCTYQFTFPTIPAERLLRCYEKAPGDHWGTADAAVDRRFYLEKKATLERLSPGRRVLDFGCFDGGFLQYLGPRFELFGVEPSEEAARKAQDRGVQVLGPDIKTMAPGYEGFFDAIVSFDVYEHLNDPVNVTRSLRKLLTPGGILLIETGDSGSWPWRWLGRRYSYCALVEHVGFLNKKSLSALAGEVGMSLVHFERVVHSRATGWSPQFMNLTYAVGWATLLGADQIGVPLRGKAAQVARGPMPRNYGLRDHFRAVLRA